MRYYYFISFYHVNELGQGIANTVIDTADKIKNMDGIRGVIEHLENNKGFKKVTLISINLLHDEV